MPARLTACALLAASLVLPGCGGPAPTEPPAESAAGPAPAAAREPVPATPVVAAPAAAAPVASPAAKPPAGSTGSGASAGSGSGYGSGAQPYAAPERVDQAPGTASPAPIAPGGNASVALGQADGGRLTVRLAAPGAGERLVRYEGALCLRDRQLGFFKVNAGPDGAAQVSFSGLTADGDYHLRVKAFDAGGRPVNAGSPAYNAFGPLAVALGATTSATVRVPLR